MKTVDSKIRLLFLCIVILAATLRIPFLDKFPPALYSDEVNQGYNAFSILKTGRDEHGIFLPVSLRSFGDWKPPLQTYVMIPTIALFGLNEWGLRLPSVIFGVLTVVLIYFITKQLLLFDSNGYFSKRLILTEKIALTSSLLLTLSPWHILQSRSAMLVGVALFCLCTFVWSMFKIRQNPLYLYIAGIFFCLGLYAYYGMRLILPLILAGLLLLLKTRFSKFYKHIFMTCLLMLVIMLPLLMTFFVQPDVVFGRARTVSIFHDRGVELTVWELLAQDSASMPTIVTHLLHNKTYFYTINILKRFFEHFDGRFLFLYGDKNTPFQIPRMGVLYFIDGALILFGIHILSKKRHYILNLLFYITFVSVLPAALTFVTPSSNRIFSMVVPLCILASIGAVFITSISIFRRILVCLFYSLSFAYFMFQYTVTLPNQNAEWWHYGQKELFNYLSKYEDNFNRITISGKVSMPYIFLLFYRQIPPDIALKELHRNYKEDAVGFEYVDSFKKYEFVRYFDWKADGDKLPGNSLLVVLPEEKVGSGVQEIHRILSPKGTPIFNVYKIL